MYVGDHVSSPPLWRATGDVFPLLLEPLVHIPDEVAQLSPDVDRTGPRPASRQSCRVRVGTLRYSESPSIEITGARPPR